MRLAVTGATGFVGRVLLDQAVAAGHQVTALTRRPQQTVPGIDWCAGDLASPAALAKLAAGSDAVIHLAGTVSAVDRRAFAASNVAGTRAVLDAARAAGVGRFVYVSSLAGREPTLSAYGASKAEAEDLVRASGLAWTIVRPPAVYGPGDREMLELFRAAKWGAVPMPKAGRASLIHVADLARLLLALPVAADETTGKVYEPHDGKPDGWSHVELGSEIGRAVGRKVRVVGLSPGTLRWVARADSMLRGARAKLTPDRAGYMAHPAWTASGEAAVPKDLWRPEIPTPEGLAATAQWYRAKGWL